MGSQVGSVCPVRLSHRLFTIITRSVESSLFVPKMEHICRMISTCVRVHEVAKRHNLAFSAQRKPVECTLKMAAFDEYAREREKNREAIQISNAH